MWTPLAVSSFPAACLFRVSEARLGSPIPRPLLPSWRSDLDAGGAAERPSILLGSSEPSGVAMALEKLEKRDDRLGDSLRPKCMLLDLLLDSETLRESEAGNGADVAFGVRLYSSRSSTSAMLLPLRRRPVVPDG